MIAAPAPLLSVRSLCKHFPIHGKGLRRRQIGLVKAADDVSFDLEDGETLGLVGESGCGKTTTGRAILRAVTPTSGEVLFRVGGSDGKTTPGPSPEGNSGRESPWNGCCYGKIPSSEGRPKGGAGFVDLAKLSEAELRPLRTQLQMIFQDPFASLNPRMTVRDIVGEPLVIHRLAKGGEYEERVAEMLKKVGLKPEHRTRYPHAFSGGQRQRIGIARALIMHPSLVVCDEAVSALDVSIQAQVINLLQDLQQEMGLAYIFIAHNLDVVRHICDRIAVMYAGRIVEIASTQALFDDPQHPYTRALLSAVPEPDPDRPMNMELCGEVADPGHLPPGCAFHPRCRVCRGGQCDQGAPLSLREVTAGHFVACPFGFPDARKIDSAQ